METSAFEDLLRRIGPQVLGVLLRRYGTDQFDLCEDAVQEAMLEAYAQWPSHGVPDSPAGWLVTSARRRMIDRIRSDAHRREREESQARLAHPLAESPVPETDDSLQLLILCCHPELNRSAQIPLTLRAVGGLTTAQIAHAYLLPEATIAQRISRAKANIKEAGFRFPTAVDVTDRLEPVLTVLYLMFNEAHTSTSGDQLYDVDLAAEAIRLTRQVDDRLPDHGETSGLLALLLLTDARRASRVDDHGRMVPLDEQDRTLWDRDKINSGLRLLHEALPGRRPTPYLIQAAIAALHAEAASTADTDWQEILALYRILEELTGNPMVSLNRVVAESMVYGPRTGLRALEPIAAVLPADHHRVLAVRAHLLERCHDPAAAETYRQASRRTPTVTERNYLLSRARRLDPN
ncbi:sigma-70 family RNA polymerase sigma factor [Microlunatus elymi]|uniref:Sigma-70 family RNA polymerase sigma factor n=1 Tax=Microlunatus elymi TaxID=2596828 RepID=A0A516PXD6_9ACTN|nr:sigma-70 family RNA polymerase sigma factor [Microlunatus elymi]QDP95837.1 sigma-70 family RNA polymerase sigma factor [Microlunatus elymi]